MSVRVLELAGAELDYDPRSPGARIPYFAWGSDVEEVVRAAVLAEVPATFKGLPLRRITLREDTGPGYWRATAEFAMLDAQQGSNPVAPPGSPSPPPPPPSPTEDTAVGTNYAFQWVMPTGRFTQSKETLASYGTAGAAVPDFRRAIGVEPDGTIQGVDLPSWPEAITVTASVSLFTLKYLKALRGLAGKTNNAMYLGHAAGKLLYLGGSATPRDGSVGGFTVTHRFAEAEFELLYPDSLAPGLPDVTITVDPFAYVWVLYQPKIQDGRTINAPAAFYVERLYDAGDFSALGLYS